MAVAVAYLVNQYPSVSHTFIRREIHALERQGVKVLRYSLRGWDLPLVDPLDLAEREKTRFVLKAGAKGLAGALLRTALRSPSKLLAALKLARQMARTSERSFPVHLAYLAEACVIAEWMAEDGAQHLHAHFATNPAEIAMLAQAVGAPAYSFTAHGSDIMDRPAQVGLPHTVANAAFAVAVCSYGRSQIFKWVPHNVWNRVEVVRCGLERGYGDGAVAPDPASRRLVCVGRLSREKGQLLLVEAVHKLAQRGIDFELVLAGDGPMRPDIEALCARHGLAGRVRITGWLDSKGIEAELRAARSLVVPSLSEGLPVVIMEAMAHRRPVVAPYLAGIPELVAHERTGWLFPAGSIDGLADAMAACLQARAATLLAMSETGHERIWTLHDVDTEAARMAALFSRGAGTLALSASRKVAEA